MWTGKGILLGVVLFAVGTVIYVYTMATHSSARAIGTTPLIGWTVMNVYHWLSLVGAPH